MMRDIRLGDDIDDFCVRCKRVMNHNVVSVLNGQAAKVRCRTCHSDHDFRHEQAPPPKVDARKAALFNEVLKKVAPGDSRAVVDDVELEIIPELDGESDVEIDGDAGAEMEVDAEPVGIVKRTLAPPAPYGAIPSPRQMAWHELEFTAFLHFSMNTFTDKEWGYGDEDPKLFNPEKLDANAIMNVLVEAGMRGVILTCKHHDGFCLWPTKTTNHSVFYSSWRDGKGDVMLAVATSIITSPFQNHQPLRVLQLVARRERRCDDGRGNRREPT